MSLACLLLVSLALLVLLIAMLHMVRSAAAIPRIGPDRATPFQGPPPRVSVIVPARNEEHRIGNCLKTLRDQDYPDLEIVVVDDCSTDRTREIVEEASRQDGRVRLIPGKPVPPGWLGKPHAIWQGVQQATGELLCFVDADGGLHPACLRQAVYSMEEHRGDLFTLGMRLECPSFWERAVQPLILQLILMAFPAAKVNDPDSEVASANGPFLLFRRSAYEAIGGHEGVKDQIVEDLILARKIKSQGLRLTWVLGPELMSLRMYPTLRDLWEGWSKNFFKSMDEKLSMALLTGVGVVWLFLLPWLAVLWSGWQVVAGPERLQALPLLLASLATLLVHGVQRTWISATYKLEATGLYLQPLGALVVLGILVNSAVKTRRGGGITWKGRTYPGGKASF
jgi:chlorobactene glucosyltransferase